MYEIFEQLMEQAGITAYKISKETGIATATLSDWKHGKSTPKQDKLQKIADYFGVSLEYLTGKSKYKTAEDEFYAKLKMPNAINKKDERDIAKKLTDTLVQLNNSEDSLMFDGEILDEDTRELLMISLENSLRIAKVNAKQKYTPKKHRN